MTVETGARAPDFDLPTTTGRARLADFAGRRLVLYFYPRDNTSGCTREASEFNALLDEFAAENTSILGVSADSLKSHANFTAKLGLRFPLAADPERTTIAAYGCWVLKKLYGREYMGIERSTFLIDDGAVAASWRQVRVAGHAEKVLEAVRKL